MPKATKDDKILKENEKEKKATVSTSKVVKQTTKKESMTEKKETKKASSDKKTSTVKSKTSTTKKTTSKKLSDADKDVKKATTKKSTSKKTSTTSSKSKSATKKSTTRKTSSTSKTKKIQSNIVAEYYDLPYRYNETVVKILYQTPTILFVYWDISDEDKDNYIKLYGEHFFYNTKPYLKVHNLTMDYYFEIEINDFANSWYLNNMEPDCKYNVELIRKIIKHEENLVTLNDNYIYVAASNSMIFPNDHILLDELPNIIKFKNVKTNETSSKDISTLHLVGINKIYNVNHFYKTFYKDEIFEEHDKRKITISSSSSSSPSSWNY